MKFHLAKVSLALLSAAFLLGCQERGSGPVGPEGLGILSGKKAKVCPGHPSCKDDDDDKTVTVTLTGGMTTGNTGTLTVVTVFSDNDKKFAMNTGPQSTGMITTHFQPFDADACLVEGPTDDPHAKARLTRLKSQLINAEIDVSSSGFSLFNVKVDRTTTGPTRGNDLQVTYDPDGKGQVILGWAHRSRAAVSETSPEKFEFTEGQIRVGEDEGRSQDRIRILCPSASVTVAVTR